MRDHIGTHQCNIDSIEPYLSHCTCVIVFFRLVVHSCANGFTSVDRPLAPVQDHFPATGKTVAVVVDSLSSLLLHCSPPILAQWMVTQPHPFLALLHSDLHTGDVIAQLDYMTTSKLVVNTSSHHPSPVAYKGAVHTTHKRPSGKLLKQVCRTTQHAIGHDCLSCSTRLTTYLLIAHHWKHQTTPTLLLPHLPNKLILLPTSPSTST